MLYEYGHIGILVIIALIFPVGALVTSWAFQFVKIRPKSKPDPVRDDIYECGLRTEGPSLVQFNFRFYYIALLFVLFDVEVVFLFPWALVFDKIGWPATSKASASSASSGWASCTLGASAPWSGAVTRE